MNSGIYKITCTTNGKYYYGSAEVFTTRWNVHKRRLRKNVHDNRRLQFAWNKYGNSAFIFEIDMLCSIDKLRQIEQVYLDVYWGRPDCMNIAKDATAPMSGLKLSKEACQKISEGNKGKIVSAETREKMRNNQLGRKKSLVERMKVSGENNVNHKVTYNQVGQLRKIANTPHITILGLSKEFSISYRKMWYIIHNLPVKHLLSAEVVEEVRSRYENRRPSIPQMAKRLGISLCAASGIISGRTWNIYNK